MHKKTEVYAYIMEQIDKLLAQGIEYYQDKDDAIKNNLLDIKKYLKTFDVLVDDAKETPKKSLNDSSATMINKLTKDFMNKLAKIKIDVLNLDTMEYPHNPPTPVKEKPKHAVRTSVFSSFLEKLNLEDFTTIAVDDPKTYHPDDGNRNSRLHSLDLTPLAAHPSDTVNVNPTPMLTEDMDEEFWKDNFDTSTSLDEFVNAFDNKKE